MQWTGQDSLALQALMHKATVCGVSISEISSTATEAPVAGYAPSAMSDAAKRRADVEVTALQQPVATTNRTKTEKELTNEPKITYPPGITSLSEWGRTRVDFGKLAKFKVSYNHVAKSPEPVFVTYRKWALERINTADGHVKDLADYLYEFKRLETELGVPSTFDGPYIPGTSQLRVLIDE